MTAESVLELVEQGWQLTLPYVEDLETLCVSQADDLKAEGDGVRVWLSRCGVEDGEPYPNKITIERYNEDGGGWYEAETYEG